jgi:hypothetical protein
MTPMTGAFVFPAAGVESVKAEAGEIVIALRRRDGQVLKLTPPRLVEADLKSKLESLRTPA